MGANLHSMGPKKRKGEFWSMRQEERKRRPLHSLIHQKKGSWEVWIIRKVVRFLEKALIYEEGNPIEETKERT